MPPVAAMLMLPVLAPKQATLVMLGVPRVMAAGWVTVMVVLVAEQLLASVAVTV